MRGLNGAGVRKSSRLAGEGSRALERGGLHDPRDFNSRSTRRLCFRLGPTFGPGGFVSYALIKLRSATVNDIRVGAGGGSSTGVLQRVSRGRDGCSRGRGNMGPTSSLAETMLGQRGLRGLCTDRAGSHRM